MAAYARSAASGSTGTTYSTTYTSSRGSVLSYDLAGELDLDSQLPRNDLSLSWREKVKRAKGLVEEFCRGDDDIGALERWLLEIGVGFVLSLADDTSAGTTSLLPAQRNLAKSWIRALDEITESTLRLHTIYNSHLVLVEGLVEKIDVPSPDQLVRFLKATVLKMLPFVDALLAAADLDASTDTAGVSNGAQTTSVKLQTLLDVREALSGAQSSTEAQWISGRSDEIVSLLSAKEHRLDEAIWNTVEQVRTSILNDGNDTEWGFQTLQGSSDICKVTRSLITYIKSLCNNKWTLNRFVPTAAELGNYVPKHDISSFLLPNQGEADPFTTLILKMLSSLEEKLAKRSKSIPGHSLRFLFLINNTHFIWQQLHPLSRMTFPITALTLRFYKAALTAKIKDYIQEYLQVSWAPVLSCLHNHKPHCFGTNSALPKFDSEFQKTYSAQKLWKVPDPELRTRLRKAIIERVVSALTEYLQDNDITNPGVTPQEREKMLLELFEG